MIRRALIRALSCAILTTLLGVKAWRLEVEDELDLSAFTQSVRFRDLDPETGYEVRFRSIGPDGVRDWSEWYPYPSPRVMGSLRFEDINPPLPESRP